MVGKLQRVALRDVWKDEAHDFTPWLENNIDVLSEAIDLTLSVTERESAAGTFSVDLIAVDEAGNRVVIENQLEKSNHDHLGKLLTYLTAIEARTAIWIVADPRPEHVSAIAWLNESSSANFYLLKVEAVKIGDSDPAPLLTAIVGPSEETKEAGATKKELADTDAMRLRFWTGLLERARAKTNLHSNISAGLQTWAGASGGKRGLTFNYFVRQHDAHVELYIDRGKETWQENRDIYDQFVQSKEQIEEDFGGALEWERTEGRRACLIKKSIKGGYRDEDKWENVQDKMIDAMMKLAAALKSHIAELELL